MRAQLIAACCCVLIAGACASSAPKNDLELTVGGGSFALELSRDVVIGLLEDGLDARLACGGDVDSDLRALLEPLARKRHATTSRREDGDTVVAKRRGSRMTFLIDARDGGSLKVTMPWAVGQCLLGRSITFDQALGTSPIEITLVTDEGRTVSASLR